MLLEKVRGARREASPHFFFVVIVFMTFRLDLRAE